MMNKQPVIYLILFFLVVLFKPGFAQESSNPNVELPDFVITGTDVINVQKAQKIKPKIISTVSESFLRPTYSPEELEVKEVSNPVKDEITLFDSLNYLNGSIEAGAGTYALPEGNISYSLPFKVGMFEAYAGGVNRRAHEVNSERYDLDGGINLSFFINNESPFLPGTRFKVHGDYGLSSYRFYGSAVDNGEHRNHNFGNASLGINHMLNDVIIFGADFSDDFSSLQDETFAENLLDVSGYAKLELANFSLAVNAGIKNQAVDNNLVNGQYTFAGFRPAVGLVFSKVLKAYFGFNYQQVKGNTFFSPYASAAFRINDNFTLFGEFTPSADFLTAGNFLRQNPYYDVQSGLNIFVEKQADIKASIKYEYDKYFQVNGGAEYISSDNMPYFNSSARSGRFYVSVADAKQLSGYIDFLFHPGPFGVFYATLKTSRTTDSSGHFLPYYPVFSGNLTYGYDFDFGLSSRAMLYYNAITYSKTGNREKLDPYVNLGLDFAYRVAKNFNLTFKLSNLLGFDNYLWRGYKEPPLDIVAGFSYKW